MKENKIIAVHEIDMEIENEKIDKVIEEVQKKESLLKKIPMMLTEEEIKKIDKSHPQFQDKAHFDIDFIVLSVSQTNQLHKTLSSFKLEFDEFFIVLNAIANHMFLHEQPSKNLVRTKYLKDCRDV